ncbi:MAG: DUF4097 family beta strand repeat protein [Clostridia bacterium]|nr:DUF4097 family beta strand repeat protein [Clostridia bacterium]
MNETISKIVDLLFEEIEPTEEVVTLHDEVMNNCQERFSDLVESGLSADDATQAVVESLKGMEEMLAEYPRKVTQRDTETEETVQTSFTFDPALSPIHTIHALHLGSCDLCIRPSQDALIHVICASDEQPVRARLQGDVLLIEPEPVKREFKREFHFDIDGREAQGKAEFSFDLSDLSGFLGKLARKLAVSFGGDGIELLVPEGPLPEVRIDSTSGDIHAEQVRLQSLHIGTASGDASLNSLTIADVLQLTTASGDVRLTQVTANSLFASTTSGDIAADEMTVRTTTRINTTSGDVNWYGSSESLEISTISGDLNNIEGSIARLNFKTVSGDARIVTDACLQSLAGRSTSGDLRVRLHTAQPVQISCRSVCGDISQHAPSDPAGSVLVELTTTSGDISVR